MNMKNVFLKAANLGLNKILYSSASTRNVRYLYQKIMVLVLTLLSWNLSTAQVYKAERMIDKVVNDYFNIHKYSDHKLFFSNDKYTGYVKNNIRFVYPKIVYDSAKKSVDSAQIFDVVSVNDTNVYALGYFPATTGVYNMLQLKNGKWDTLPAFKNGRSNSMLEIKGNLFLRSYDYNSQKSRVLKWDLKNAPTLIYEGSSDIYLMAKHKDKYLVVLCDNKRIIYDGSKSDTASFVNTYGYAAYTNTHDSGNLYFLYSQNNKIFTLNPNNQIVYFDSIITPNNLNIIAEQNGYLYLGDYSVGLLSRIKITSHKKETVLGIHANNDFINIISGDNVIYLYRLIYKSGPYYCRFHIIMDGSFVSGILYEDADSSCTLTKGDRTYKRLRGYAASATDTFPIISNDTGYFQVILPAGPYSYRYYIKEKYVNNTSVSCNIKDSFPLPIDTTRNVPYTLQSGKHDVGIDLVAQLGWRARQGFSEKYVLTYRNHGTTKEDIQVEIQFPDSVTFDSSSVSPKSTSGNKITFEFKNVDKFSVGQITLYFKVHVNKRTGEIIKWTCKAPVLTGETDSSDNVDTLALVVRGAYDPNSKHSYPEGIVYAPVKKIDYNIHFQNMGTDTAYRVVVVDTFMPNFPLYKLQMTGSSHNYNIRVEPGNVIIWTFENIKLPPVSENVRASQGFVSFEAPLISATKPGITISNRAHIYFDYQKPVITEWNKIEHSEWSNSLRVLNRNAGALLVYPNPVSAELSVEVPSGVDRVCVYDIEGRLVHSVSASDELTISMQAYPPGVYVVVAGNQFAKVIKN